MSFAEPPVRRLLLTLAIITGVFLVGILIDLAAGTGEGTLWLVGFYVVYAFAVALWFRTAAERPMVEFIEVKPPELPIDYPGDVHEVVDLEGIGPTYAERLHAAGIFHTQELLLADDAHIQKATGAAAKVVLGWKSMAQLVKVKGIGPQYAEALTRGGIDGIEGLRACDPTKLAKDVNAYLDGLNSTVIGQRISAKRIQTWRAAARKMAKGPIDVAAIKVRPLESKAARAGAGSVSA